VGVISGRLLWRQGSRLGAELTNSFDAAEYVTRFASREALEDDEGDDEESSDEDVSSVHCASELLLRLI
jgi:hypothetical protein